MRTKTMVGWLAVLGTIVMGCAVVAAEDTGRKIGTCGPPPRKNPERQTASESAPPLPLPATPLRRSEPKAEPEAPILIAKLEYGTTQDWSTDPGDLDNLMRHARYELGVWYGSRKLSMSELVATYAAGKPCSIPILYITGHEAFELTDPQRSALRQYMLDGGTLLADACCGRKEFSTSFRKEVQAMFPDRAFTALDPDHPLFRAFYPYSNVHVDQYDGGVKNETQGPPEMLGLAIGCRTAVILTAHDMSCGWDEHSHDSGDRMIPGDAIRMGVNDIAYVSALRPLAEAQSVTREIRAPMDRPRQHLFFAQVRHQGDWNPDPNSVYQMLRHVALESSLAVEFDLKPVDAQEAKLAPYPFLYMTGHTDPKFSDAEVQALRNHLQAGGFLFVNNCCGAPAFDRAMRALVARMFPDQPIAQVPKEHAVMQAFATLGEAHDRLTGAIRPVELEGIAIKERFVLVYSKNDAVSQLKQVSNPYGNGYDATGCRQVCLNVIAYALQN